MNIKEIEKMNRVDILRQDNGLWETAGLSIEPSMYHTNKISLASAVVRHNLVSEYLKNHPDIMRQWKNDQTGYYKYYDVLEMAEIELLSRFKDLETKVAEGEKILTAMYNARYEPDKMLCLIEHWYSPVGKK